MSVQELQKYTAVSKYARWMQEVSRREVWSETVDRFRGMMLTKYPQLSNEIHDAFEYVRRMDVLGSQRALQFGGKPALQHNARIYNCCGSYCDRLRFFQEAFYLLLAGCGTGFSVQGKHVQHLPRFSRKRLAGARLPKKQFRIPDSIEGWADSQGVLLTSFHGEPIKGFEEYLDCDVEFIFDDIRPEGSPLSFGIGKAPGPKALARSLAKNRQLLLHALSAGLTKLDSIHAYDFTMHESDAVLSGGVRRSASICLFDLADKLMASAKTGNWRETNPQRGRSNNSASLLRGQVSYEEFSRLFENTKEFGEPGFYWTSHPDMLPNPCVEIGFWAKLLLSMQEVDALDYQGPVEWNGDKFAVSGWQFCNLSLVNGKTVRNEVDFYKRCEVASFIGTLQAGFTDFPYLGKVSEEIARREALLGVSISGIMHHPEILLNEEIQRKGADIVLKTNEKWAAEIGINPCARGTCVKPDGNCASLLGSLSGIGRRKFIRGFRITQANKSEAPYQHFRSINPEACEESVWSANKTDDVIRFCCEYEGEGLERDTSALQQLEDVKSTYLNWVCPGKVEARCTQPWLSHNVSNTISVKSDEWNDVKNYIFDNQNFLAGISLLSSHGDRDYPQAPFTTVHNEEEIRKEYGARAWILGPILVDHAVECKFRDLWDAADLAFDHWDLEKRQPTIAQKNWVNDLTQFAELCLAGDVKKATYCLKDIYNWQLYQKLKASYKPVDYSLMVEKDNGTNLQGEIACAGGACEA